VLFKKMSFTRENNNNNKKPFRLPRSLYVLDGVVDLGEYVVMVDDI
jgi:hypothetical protein